MSLKHEDEDYWNESTPKAFSFDEGEFSSKSTLFDGGRSGSSKSHFDFYVTKTSSITDTIFDGVPLISKPETAQRPLGSLISKHSLNRILSNELPKPPKPVHRDEELNILRRQVESQWVPPDVSKTVKLIMLGQPYSLHLYRSLDLKTQLLDEAIKSGDGDAILAVVLFLSKSLKKTLFYQLLQNRQVAVSQYIQYLSTRQVGDLIDLLEMMGHHREAAMQQLKISVNPTVNLERKLQKLKYCFSNHFSIADAKDKQFIISYIGYLEWLCAVKPSNPDIPVNSVLCSLEHICANHWYYSKNTMLSPSTLCSQQSITDRQYQWTVLKTRSSLKAWEDIAALFLTKGWLGGKKLKSVISMEKIIAELQNHGAPPEVLAQYLELIDNLENRLELSKKLGCHQVAINVYVALKERQGLVEFKANLSPQSQDYLYAETMLKSNTKWKN